MNNFEKNYKIDNSRESDIPREKHHSIELSDHEHLIREEPLKVSKEMEQEGWIYKKPPPEDAMSHELKEKFKKAIKICQDTKVIDLSSAEPPPIEINLEIPELEKAIKQGKNNERKKSKSSAKRTKKDNSKSNKSAVASLEEKL